MPNKCLCTIWLSITKTIQKKPGSLWNYCRDEPNSGVDSENNNMNYSIIDSKSFDFKTSITERSEGTDRTKGVENTVPLKYLRNFWGTLNMPLINYEINLILTWSENCVITSKATRDTVSAQGGSPAVNAVNNPTNVTFKIKETKLYVTVVTLSTQVNKNFLEQLK